MEIDHIRARAQAMGIVPGKLKRVALVRAIQSREGNQPCFAGATAPQCGALDCLWRDDCLRLAATARPPSSH